ncbi:MAG TPA: hypothetical protein VEK15_11865 [Vicinamibacteria bacterium]|nr:hypothetical protein [Vicinamibacteria bacterium]
METIPEPNKHLVHFHGAYANRVRRIYREPIRHEEQGQVNPTTTTTTTTTRRAANKRWRELIYRVYEVGPLTCDRCGAEMKVLALITEHEVIHGILDHRDKNSQPRAPPAQTSIH